MHGFIEELIRRLSMDTVFKRNFRFSLLLKPILLSMILSITCWYAYKGGQIIDCASNQISLNTNVVPDRPNYECKRYAHLSGPPSGLGHIVTRIVVGRFYALQKNATLVIDKEHFHGMGGHGSYPWAVEYFGFDRSVDIADLNLSSLTVVEELTWHSNRGKEPLCDVLFMSCDSCCSILNRSNIHQKSWCFGTNQWAFAASREYFFHLSKTRENGDSSHILPILNQCWVDGLVDVVWHVRIGDLVLDYTTRKFYIDEVMKNIYRIFENHKVQLFVLSEGDTSPFDFHPWFKSHGARFLDSLSVKDSLDLMIECSVLVTSGSSFPAVATYFKSEKTISFQSRPKEGTGTMDIFQHAILDEHGNVTYPNITALRQRASVITSRIFGQNVDI